MGWLVGHLNSGEKKSQSILISKSPDCKMRETRSETARKRKRMIARLKAKQRVRNLSLRKLKVECFGINATDPGELTPVPGEERTPARGKESALERRRTLLNRVREEPTPPTPDEEHAHVPPAFVEEQNVGVRAEPTPIPDEEHAHVPPVSAEEQIVGVREEPTPIPDEGHTHVPPAFVEERIVGVREEPTPITDEGHTHVPPAFVEERIVGVREEPTPIPDERAHVPPAFVEEHLKGSNEELTPILVDEATVPPVPGDVPPVPGNVPPVPGKNSRFVLKEVEEGFPAVVLDRGNSGTGFKDKDCDGVPTKSDFDKAMEGPGIAMVLDGTELIKWTRGSTGNLVESNMEECSDSEMDVDSGEKMKCEREDTEPLSDDEMENHQPPESQVYVFPTMWMLQVNRVDTIPVIND